MLSRTIVLAAGVSAVLSGCYRDSDDFNAKAAQSVCRYNSRDPELPILNRTEPSSPPTDPNPSVDTNEAQYEPYGGPDCEDRVEANLASCSTQCDYSPRKARRCLRKLKRSLRRDVDESTDLGVCDRVYTCAEEVPSDVVDQCRITAHNCALGDRAPSPALFALGFLGLWVRRRRRS